MKKENNLAWLKNGILALGFAGLYSIILVILRTPGLSDFFENKDLFKPSLIIHVNLSVLVWLLSITAIIWSKDGKLTYFEMILGKICFIAMLLMIISPVFDINNSVMNNYIPIVENIFFIIGLSLFGISLLVFSLFILVKNLYEAITYNSYLDNLVITKITSTLLYIGVWVCFVLSYMRLDYLSEIFPMDLEYYYEFLFWSGGHLLQFIYTQIFMYIWLLLVARVVQGDLFYQKIYTNLLIFNFLAAITIFYGHIKYQIPDTEFKIFFTYHMRYMGGIAPTLFFVVLLKDLYKNNNWISKNNFALTAIFASAFLFFFGGLIGIFISGPNVQVPAHYHGSIVGISIAFLGFAYLLCLHKQEQNKWPNIQIYLIAIGQLLHISGLALSGGYGVLRKNTDNISSIATKLCMGIMGLGGFIAIIAGLMFVYICVKRLYKINILGK